MQKSRLKSTNEEARILCRHGAAWADAFAGQDKVRDNFLNEQYCYLALIGGTGPAVMERLAKARERYAKPIKATGMKID